MHAIGDEAFAFSEHVLRPYLNRNVSIQQRIYNYTLTKARRMVECVFDILANKLRIFHRPLAITPQFCNNIVKICAYCTFAFAETVGFS